MFDPAASPPDEVISFINRDHIISVIALKDEIVVTTTPGTQITIPISAGALEKFVDELANHVESNFVSIASTGATVR